MRSFTHSTMEIIVVGSNFSTGICSRDSLYADGRSQKIGSTICSSNASEAFKRLYDSSYFDARNCRVKSLIRKNNASKSSPNSKMMADSNSSGRSVRRMVVTVSLEKVPTMVEMNRCTFRLTLRRVKTIIRSQH